MRLSRHFGITLRATSVGADTAGNQFLVRAGYLRQLGAGLFSALPLARRSLKKIEAMLREEMDAIGGQELLMPLVQPAELWQRAGRYADIGAELLRFDDRKSRPMVLAMTHEEALAELCRSEIHSYRQLPQLVYQIQTKFRDDPRPRAGLIRVREFTMKDSYSLDRDNEGLDRQYRAHFDAYRHLFARCDLPVMTVGADVGIMGGSAAHELMYLTPIGEDTIVICGNCGYTANRQIATFAKPAPSIAEPLPIERVSTPGAASIEALTKLLDIEASQIAKAVFFMVDAGARPGLIIAVVRGDMDVNETKLASTVGATELRPATEAEMTAAGAVRGYASPIGVSGVTVVDDLLATSANLVAGANEQGAHFRNVNIPRDFAPSIVADIVSARAGDACSRCGAALRTCRGVEVANFFKLGTRYSDVLGVYFRDTDGVDKLVVMGSYGIGLGRLLACIAEEHHDERGLCWPVSVAPFSVHLIGLDAQARDTAEQLYASLTEAGVDVLYDDREERPGVKFADADLMGMPLRVTVSRRSLAGGGVELRQRSGGADRYVALGEAVTAVRKELQFLWSDLATL